MAAAKRKAKPRKELTRAHEKRPLGRPTLYKPEYAVIARKLCKMGATNADLAEALNISIFTVEEWLRKRPEFSRAVKDTRLDADAQVEKSLYQRATGYQHPAVKIFMPAGAKKPVYAKYTEHYAPDTAAAFIWLKNRQPDRWRDRIEHTGAEGGPIQTETRRIDIASLDVEQRAQLRAILLGTKRPPTITDVEPEPDEENEE